MGLAADPAAGQPAVGPVQVQRPAPRRLGRERPVARHAQVGELQAIDEPSIDADLAGSSQGSVGPPGDPQRGRAGEPPVGLGQEAQGAGQHEPLDRAGRPRTSRRPPASRYIQIPSPAGFPPKSSPPSGPTRHPSGVLLTWASSLFDSR